MVGDLSDSRGSRRSSGSLRLVVRDLGDTGSCLGLRLVVRDLRHASGGWGLRLVIRDLRDAGSSLRLGLFVRYLRNAGSCLGLGLSVGGLRDTLRGRARRITLRKGVDVDWRALRSPAAIVEIVEATRVAGVEDGRATKSKRAVATDGEARGIDSTSLRWRVKLELEVVGNVSSIALLIVKLAVLERQDERAHAARLTL